jgi:chitinase
MRPTRSIRWTTAGVSLAAVALLAAGLPAQAATDGTTDTTAPSVPQNLRDTARTGGNAVLTWDAATDDSGAIYHYWVLVDGQQRARPAGTTYSIQTLVNLCRITPGPHQITVQAVDRALNRSGPSNAIRVVVT